MNEIFRVPIAKPSQPGTTQAGDGLPRRKWTSDEVQRMIAAGIVRHGERFELYGGELVAMASRGQHHELMKIALNDFFGQHRGADLRHAPETPFRLSDHDEPEPEFIVFPRAIKPRDVRGDTVLLVVEIADSSLGIDLGRKAKLYASYGVRDYWVIDAVRRLTYIHREPGPAGYASVVEVAGSERLVPLLAPALAVRLDDLEL